MFNNPSAPDRSTEEASVTEVDPIRKVCKVKTLSGQNLTGVLWGQPSGGASRGGDRMTPLLGDRVIINSHLGYPVICQFLPKLQTSDNTSPLHIDAGEVIVDTGNFAPAGRNVLGDQNGPKDMVVGDRIISSPGGGLVGILRAGSVLLRSSRFSEIFLSKIHDLVRISSRNFEHYSDVGSDVIRNIKGRIYRHVGYSKKIQDAKVEAYTYNQYIGDVALAESFKTDYTKSDTLPPETNVVFKEQILDRVLDEPYELMKREIYLNGDQDFVVKSADGVIFTRIKCTKDDIHITYKDINVIKINTDEISLRKNGDPRSVVITDTSVLSTFKKGTVKMDDNAITSTYDGSVHKIDSTGITSTRGTSIHKIDGTSITSTKDGSVQVIDATGITSTKDGSVHKIDATGVTSSKGGATYKVTALGATMTKDASSYGVDTDGITMAKDNISLKMTKDGIFMLAGTKYLRLTTSGVTSN